MHGDTHLGGKIAQPSTTPEMICTMLTTFCNRALIILRPANENDAVSLLRSNTAAEYFITQVGSTAILEASISYATSRQSDH